MNPLSENWIVKYECLDRDGVMQCCGGRRFPTYPSEADIDRVIQRLRAENTRAVSFAVRIEHHIYVEQTP